MYEKDYILRMIEMLGVLLRAIFGMITRGNYQQAEEQLHEAYLTMLRKDASFFHRIPDDELTTTLISDHNYTHAHLEILAELFYAEAVLQYAKDQKANSRSCFHKSLLLYDFVDKTYKTFSAERIDRMAEIRNRIAEMDEMKNNN